MDDPRPSNKPSGLPRMSRLPVQPSKLPLPGTSSIRPSPSYEALIPGSRSLNLRKAPSQGQLASSKSDPTIAPAAPAKEQQRPSRLPSTQPKVLPRGTPSIRTTTTATTTGVLRSPTYGRAGSQLPQSPVNRSAPGQAPNITKPSLQRLTRQIPSSVQPRIVSPLTPDRPSALPTSPETLLGFNDIRAQLYKPRPSLSDRTIDTLSQLPSSPGVKGRPSAFYDGSIQKKASSRPSSSHQSDDSNKASSRPSSRPGSSSGLDDNRGSSRASNSTYSNPLSPTDSYPLRNGPSVGTTSYSTKVNHGDTSTSTAGSATALKGLRRPHSPSLGELPRAEASATPAPKTMAARPLKPKPSLTGGFKKPSAPPINRNTTADANRKASLASRASSTTSFSGKSPANSSTSATSANTTLTSTSNEGASGSYRKSSAALRDQIAKAKAAKKSAPLQSSSPPAPSAARSPLIPTDTTFDFGLSNDPFNQNKDAASQAKIMQGKLEAARTSGRLNIAAMGLRDIPTDILNMYNLDTIGGSGGAWAESVDLTRFVAANNEIEVIDELIFPDVDPREFADDDDGHANLFAGLEALNLHGNCLTTLPMGMRRLSLLTSLDLSQNKLDNACLKIISEITSLVDLNLAGNLLHGPLDPSLSKLDKLEILDVHNNQVSSLPSNFENLIHLRILNISENSFADLPFALLSTFPITELNARKNQLSGTLIDDTVDTFVTLRNLDVSSNQLAQLTSSDRGQALTLPSLNQLSVSANRLQQLPDLGTWTSLVTILAEENSISSIPDGFSGLHNLRSADFSSNDIRVIPAEIGRMDNLASLRLSGNPLRDKKFVSLTTDDLKDILLSRLEPATEFHEHEQDENHHKNVMGINGREADEQDESVSEHFATPPTSAPHSPARSRPRTLSAQTWPVKPGGILDRSHTESSALHPVVCSKIAAIHSVREVQLHHNLFPALPDSLSFFAQSMTVLSLAHNQLDGESYIGSASGNENLDLPALKELNLSWNRITNLAPLVASLAAPQLQKLDVSCNGLAALPTEPGERLRDAFPALEILSVADNKLTELEPSAIAGLHVVDAQNNAIPHLNPRIGLLGGSGGLRHLEVGGNSFRVPRWEVLQQGTEATLRWLRTKVPAHELSPEFEDE